MTSCVVSFVFLISLFSSIKSNDVTEITEEKITLLNDVSENKPGECSSSSSKWTLTQVAAQKFEVSVHDNHLHLDMENLNAIYTSESSTIEVKGLDAKLKLSLKQEAGKLKIEQDDCVISAGSTKRTSPGIIGFLKSGFVNCVSYFFKQVGCFGLKHFGLSKITQKLESMGISVNGNHVTFTKIDLNLSP